MKKITNELPQNPAVKIIVDGLFIFCINENTGQAEIGVYEYANQHDFFIRVSKKDHACQSELFKDGIPLHKLNGKVELKKQVLESGDISIGISNQSIGIETYQNDLLTAEDFKSNATDRNSSYEMKIFDELGPIIEQYEAANLELPLIEERKIVAKYSSDFRWVIDLESDRFQVKRQNGDLLPSKKLEVIPGVIHRKIFIKNGIAYTEKLLGRRITNAYEKAAELSKIETVDNKYWIANQVCFAIQSIPEGESLSITYRNAKGETSLALPPLDGSIYYEVLINNNCPDFIARDNETRSDFQHYYNVLNTPIPERIEMSILIGQGHERFPCDTVFLGQTNELP